MSLLSQFFAGSGAELVPIEVFAVGGGGGGTPATSPGGGGGGGAGQVQYVRTFAQKKVSFAITIGGGGSTSSIGSNTIFSNIISYGGAGGNPTSLNFTFGSSGGASSTSSTPELIALSSLAGPSYTNFGYAFSNNGGNAAGPGSGSNGGGGGGAITAGLPAVSGPTPTGGTGGSGVPALLFGISLAVGGGGGGGAGPGLQGGLSNSGGGAGGTSALTIGSSGTANTGGGGGGGGGTGQSPNGTGPGGSGGSGILVIRYPTAFAAATVTGNTPTPAQPGYNVYRWNSGPATITFN